MTEIATETVAGTEIVIVVDVMIEIDVIVAVILQSVENQSHRLHWSRELKHLQRVVPVVSLSVVAFKRKVEHSFGKFAITSKISRISTEHIDPKDS